MSVELINILNALLQTDQCPYTERIKVEAEIATQLLPKLTDGFVADIDFFRQIPIEILKLTPHAYNDNKPNKSRFAKIKRAVIRLFSHNKYIESLAQFLNNHYSIDAEFSAWVLSHAGYISNLYKPDHSQDISVIDFGSCMFNTDIALRYLLLEISRRWKRENCEEPIFWKISDCLQDIALRSSGKTLVHTTGILIVFGQQKEISAHEKYPIDRFLIEANEEKNGSILDNLIISMQAYNSLMESGWQPDEFEIENLQMTVDLFLQYLEKKGYSPVEQIGNELMISLDESLKNFRYTGSPFISKTDQKQVHIVAPGWKIKDRLIIRPKVREN